MRLTILATLVTLLVLPPGIVAQTRLTFVPAVSFVGIYDDNLNAETNGTAGKMLVVRPTVEGSWESPRLSFLSLYSQDMQRSNFSALNSFDGARHAFLDIGFRRSPLTTFGLTGRYDRTDTPGAIDFETGILGARLTAQRLQLSPFVVRRLTSRSVLTAGYDFTRENELDTPSGTLHQARISVSREWTTRSAVVLTYLPRYFVDGGVTVERGDDIVSDAQINQPAVASHSTSQSLLAGYTRELSPTTHISVYAGPRVSSYRSGLKTEASASLRRDTGRFDVAADYWHGETIILGIEGPVAVDSGTLRVAWPFHNRWGLLALVGASDIDTLDLREARVYSGALGATWNPFGMYSVAVGYGVDYQQGDIRRRLDENILRHVFRVSLTVAPRLFRSKLPPDEAARVKGVIR